MAVYLPILRNTDRWLIENLRNMLRVKEASHKGLLVGFLLQRLCNLTKINQKTDQQPKELGVGRRCGCSMDPGFLFEVIWLCNLVNIL